MSKGYSYLYTGTKGHIIAVASSLPENNQQLISEGWIDISHPKQASSGHYTYKEPSTGLRIRFDKAKSGATGFAGKNHYHIFNPDATSTKDMYLDAKGNPVSKNSKSSHILPGRK